MREAASKLFVSQSALSATIHELEEEDYVYSYLGQAIGVVSWKRFAVVADANNAVAFIRYPGTADEVANVAELLMSDKGAFITGSTFLIDGGATSSYYGPLKPEA